MLSRLWRRRYHCTELARLKSWNSSIYQYPSKYAKVDLALGLAIPFLDNNKMIIRDSYKDDCPWIILTL